MDANLDEEKIKAQILEEDIQNEIFTTPAPIDSMKPPPELKGELRKQQFKKCREGLAQYQETRRKVKEELKAKERQEKEEEKRKLKEKIKEEIQLQKLRSEVTNELKEDSSLLYSVAAPPPPPPIIQPVEEPIAKKRLSELTLEQLEEFIEWKNKQKKEEKPRKEKKRPPKESVTPSDSEDEDDYIPSSQYQQEKYIPEEEWEEGVMRKRAHSQKKLPPKPSLVRNNTMSYGPSYDASGLYNHPSTQSVSSGPRFDSASHYSTPSIPGKGFFYL